MKFSQNLQIIYLCNVASKALPLCLTLQTHRQLWVEIAEKLTVAVQQIIEFAKMVPGFMSLLQDDQIMLLKGGELCSVFVLIFQTSLSIWLS